MKRILLILLAVITLSSCSGTYKLTRTDENVKKVKIGMTEQQVVRIMGKKYILVTAVASHKVIQYPSSQDSYGYKFHFEDKKLESFTRECVDNHNRHHHETGKPNKHRH